MRSENERQPAVVASMCILSKCILYTYIQYTYIYNIISIYIYIFVQLIIHHIPKVRNKTSYEPPSFHTSGTVQNVPYTTLTHSHIFEVSGLIMYGDCRSRIEAMESNLNEVQVLLVLVVLGSSSTLLP